MLAMLQQGNEEEASKQPSHPTPPPPKIDCYRAAGGLDSWSLTAWGAVLRNDAGIVEKGAVQPCPLARQAVVISSAAGSAALWERQPRRALGLAL